MWLNRILLAAAVLGIITVNRKLTNQEKFMTKSRDEFNAKADELAVAVAKAGASITDTLQGLQAKINDLNSQLTTPVDFSQEFNKLSNIGNALSAITAESDAADITPDEDVTEPDVPPVGPPDTTPASRRH